MGVTNSAPDGLRADPLSQAAHPLDEGRFMRRLEVERIDGVPAQAGHVGGCRACPASARVGAGDAALGPQIPPANPRRWPAARAAGLVWRLRAVPRTHGTRAASGHRPDGYYGPPARSSLTVRGSSPRREARPDAGSHLTGGEGNRHQWSAERRARRSQDARPRKRHLDAPSGAPLPSCFFERETRSDGVPGAKNLTQYGRRSVGLALRAKPGPETISRRRSAPAA